MTIPTKDTIPYVNIKEAARLKGLKYRTMQAYVQAGRIPSIEVSARCVLIERRWLDEWQPRPQGRPKKAETIPVGTPKESWGKLTAKEQKVLDLLKAGHSKAFIAAYFTIKVGSVQGIITKLRQKGFYDYQGEKPGPKKAGKE